MKSSRILAVLPFILTLASTSHAAPAAPARSAQETLRNAVAEAKPKLGELEPWQLKIFNEEAVPHYQRFIKDYRPVAGGLDIQVDVDGLKKYVAFSGPKSLKRAQPSELRTLYLLRPAAGCARCEQSVNDIRKLVKARLENRGLVPVLMTPEDQTEAQLPKAGATLAGAKETATRALEWAQSKNFAGAVVVQWGPAPVEDIDTAHADEKKFVIQSVTEAREVPVAGSGVPARTYSHEEQLELLGDESFETGARRLLTDAFAEFGARAMIANVPAPATSGGDEITLSLGGIRDYAHFQKVKASIQASLASTLLEDRKLSRGKAVFGLRTAKTVEELKPLLTGLNMEPGRLAVVDSDARSIKVEIRQ